MSETQKPTVQNMSSNTAIVTVLYYEAPAGLIMHNEILTGLAVSESGRVMIPQQFRRGKSIIAVLEGECTILNSLGERVYAQKVLG